MNRIRFLLIWILIVIIQANNYAQDNKKPDGVMPVEMVYFIGSVVKNSVELRWGTATEINNYGYFILRSDTSFIWEEIDFVEKLGESFNYEPLDYVYIDSTIAKNGEYFYLLRQMDVDGNFELLEDTVKVYVGYITTVKEQFKESSLLKPRDIELYQNFPNPFNPSTTISFTVNKSAHILLKIYTLIGEEIATIWNKPTNIGTYYVKFNASKLSSGIYWYQLSSNDNKITKKFILIK